MFSSVSTLRMHVGGFISNNVDLVQKLITIFQISKAEYQMEEEHDALSSPIINFVNNNNVLH